MNRALLPESRAPDQGALRATPLRFVTAASLFDGHDASINVMRRILQGAGVEVIHLGHNRSVREVVSAAVQEDADAVAVSSYQGGHIEYFKYLVDQLKEQRAVGVRVFGGGGGVIVPSEVEELHRYGVERIYSPADGQELGLEGIIDDMIARCARPETAPVPFDGLAAGHWPALARLLTQVERGELDGARREELARRVRISRRPVVIGITGTGGAGKSSLTDEVVRRFRLDFADRLRIGILAVDPSRRRTGGALLGDRIRMNAIDHPGIYMRSLATRGANAEVPERLQELLEAMRLAAFDVIVVETSGIGQGDAGIVSHVDVSAYVMTPEYGSASQLEKIDMLDFADVVAINKFDRRGAQDALRDVSKQMQRNRRAFGAAPDAMPVYGTIASRFNDDGVTAFYQSLLRTVRERCSPEWPEGALPEVKGRTSTRASAIVPARRVRYLAEVAETVRGYRRRVESQVRIARERQSLRETQAMLEAAGKGRVDAIDALLEERPLDAMMRRPSSTSGRRSPRRTGKTSWSPGCAGARCAPRSRSPPSPAPACPR